MNSSSLINNGKKKKMFFTIVKNRKVIISWVTIALITLLASFLTLFVSVRNRQGNILDTISLFYTNWKIVLQLFITGFSLGISAYYVQQITNNRLIDTSTIGIGNVCLIGLLLLAFSLNFEVPENATLFNKLLPFIFIISSAVAAIFLYYFAKTKTNFNHTKLIVAGLFINFIAIALAISLRNKLSLTTVNTLDRQLVGSFDTKSDVEWAVGASFFSVSILWLLIRSPKIRIVITDKYVAEQLGLPVRSINFELIMISGILTGVAYILAGNILFLGIASANIAYSLFGKKNNQSMIYSGLVNTVFLLFGQFILQNIVFNRTDLLFETPMVTPLLVAPFFIIVITLKKKI
ncbi:iron ABC transporter permease [Ureaplasma canigenitalium]|uniref:iron ABC transporter permease n=1 Tax=Ureaplasma canigenitalium TaxID=42092 RepID=UPI000AE261AF|nr:iron ABC transporter permease [Ureaplasma canigenitalium]